jgi:hypothetical protein
MNLGPPATAPGNRRPHQMGRALGFDASGAPVAAAVEWMFDTGADVGVVRNSVGNRFQLTATGASASPTTGGGGILVKNGLQVEFAAEDPSGVSVTVVVTGSVGVKSNNAGSDILGMDQLASRGARVTWDPTARAGTVIIPAVSPAASPAPPPRPMSTLISPPQRDQVIVDHGTWLDVGGVRVEKRLIIPPQ